MRHSRWGAQQLPAIRSRRSSGNSISTGWSPYLYFGLLSIPSGNRVGQCDGAKPPDDYWVRAIAADWTGDHF